MDLLDGQLPGVNRKSSIAMSPCQPSPLIPSNVTYSDDKKQHINQRMKMIDLVQTSSYENTAQPVFATSVIKWLPS